MYIYQYLNSGAIVVLSDSWSYLYDDIAVEIESYSDAAAI
jgi:hypothetical protein